MKNQIISLLILMTLFAAGLYARAFHDPGLGRWLNRDPIEEKGGRNLYSFCNGDALNRTDAFGEDSQGPILPPEAKLPRQFKWRCEHRRTGGICTFWYECTFLVNPGPPKDKKKLDECMAKQRSLWDSACKGEFAVSLGRICKGYEKCHNDFGSGVSPLVPKPGDTYPSDPTNDMPPSGGLK